MRWPKELRIAYALFKYLTLLKMLLRGVIFLYLFALSQMAFGDDTGDDTIADRLE